MRILILNWRCPRHPQAGGAELLTQRIAEWLIQWGNPVTWFTAEFPGSLARENINGIEIIRRGGQTTVHWQAWQWYRRTVQPSFDVIIDEINTIPFFTPFYAGKTRSVAFIPQLAREVWWHEAPPWLAPIGYLSEPLYLQAYRNRPVITISSSTAESLRGLGFKGPIEIIPMATDFEAEASLPSLSEKESVLTLLFVGRVVSSKRVAHMVEAVSLLRQQGVKAQLWIAGSPDSRYQAQLEALVHRHQLHGAVHFLGKVSDEQKRELYQRAHLLLACSVREGWGLTVTEANRVGTPAVVYNVPGLRDSTRHNVTGWICSENTPGCLANAIAALWRSPAQYELLRQAAFGHSRQLTWESTALKFREHLERWK